MAAPEGLHVILGGSGGVGSAVARLLAQERVAVRAVNRSGKIPFLPRRIQVMGAEAIVKETLRPVCDGAAVIYHCIHPTRDYELLVPITRHIVDIAAEIGALLVMAGNMWPYGPVNGPITEDLPYRRTGTTGRVYIEVSEIVSRAVAEGRIRAIMGRAAHCYGPFVRRDWPGTDFNAAMLAKPNSVVGDLDAPHSFIFVEDFARGLISLATDAESVGKVWHIAGPKPVSIREFLNLMYAELRMETGIQKRSDIALFLRSLVNQEAHRLREMRYQFDHPFVVDGGRFEAKFDWRPTPHAEGIRRTFDYLYRLEAELKKTALTKR